MWRLQFPDFHFTLQRILVAEVHVFEGLLEKAVLRTTRCLLIHTLHFQTTPQVLRESCNYWIDFADSFKLPNMMLTNSVEGVMSNMDANQ